MSRLLPNAHPGRKPPRVYCLAAVALLMALWPAPARGDEYDFSQATPAGLDRDWSFTSMGWSLSSGALRDTGSSRSYAVLLKELCGDNIWAEAEVMVQGRRGDGWKVAGISLYQDVRNFWHLALVESPGDTGRRFFELKLMRDGQWGALGTESSRPAARYGDPDAGWNLGRRYRLRIEKRWNSVRGRVWDDRGILVIDIEFKEVRDDLVGLYPALDNGGFDASFLKIAYSKALPEPSVGNLTQKGKGDSFYTVVSDSGIDWFSAPDGGRLLSIGCEWVKYREIWCQALGYSAYLRNSEMLFGSESAWAVDVTGKLNSWGFNTVGQSDRNEEISNQGLAFAPILRLGQGFSDIAAIVPKTFWTGFPDVFDSRFERYCRMAAELNCRPWRQDPDLLGYYLDNELEWFGKDGKPWSLFTNAMKLGPKSPAKKAAVEMLKTRHRSITVFNKVWGTEFSSWQEVAEFHSILEPKSPKALDDAHAFVSLCAQKYFETTTAAVRRADPNHLILGSRFAWLAPEPAWSESGRYCDVVSFNCYPRVEILSGEIPGLKDTIRNRHRLCRKPLLISEWGFPALDAGLPSTHGAGMRVDDQVQRAYCAARFQEEALSLPFVVGTSWFMWADEPALGVTDSFPENSNYGLVDVRHRPYLRVASALRSINLAAGEIHKGRGGSRRSNMLQADIFSKYGFWGQSGKPEVRMSQGRLEAGNGNVRLVLTPGKSVGADSILWNGISMGSYYPLIFQRRGKDGWLAPNRITGFCIEDFPNNGRALDFTAEYFPGDTGWASFSLRYRIIVPPQGSWFLVEVLEITSLDPKPWTLVGYYHYIPSMILDGPSGDMPFLSEVPNYWLRHGGWFEAKTGLHFGALSLEDDGWVFQPYIDSLGRQHPDIFKSIDRKMEQGKTCRLEGRPIVIYMGREGRSDNPWTKAAFQAWEWLKESKRQESP